MMQLDRAATRELDDAGVDPRLRELVRIRASQLNGCAYCIDMHTKDARLMGETEQRIYALSAWRETPFFNSRERAALAFTESVTLMADTHVPDEAYAEVAAAFNDLQVSALVSLIIVINAWNAAGVATRAWEPGSYQPQRVLSHPRPCSAPGLGRSAAAAVGGPACPPALTKRLDQTPAWRPQPPSDPGVAAAACAAAKRRRGARARSS